MLLPSSLRDATSLSEEGFLTAETQKAPSLRGLPLQAAGGVYKIIEEWGTAPLRGAHHQKENTNE